MKLSNLLALSLFSLSLLCSNSNAQETDKNTLNLTTQERQHNFGLVIGFAIGEYKNSTQDGDGFIQHYLFYNYRIIDNFSVEVAYNTATEFDSWQCIETGEDSFTCGSRDKLLFGLLANEMELDSFVVAIKGQAPLSKRNSLYAKLGGQYYDYKFTRNGHFVEGEDGTGVFFEAGWQFQWGMGIGMNVGLRYQDLGELTLKSPNVGISYAF
ncbi:outer membrane beta-barrel protein [Colwellia piezophila]|uniref:outer membrane beta-barrel protein n=1 Tax=Colwellia piezophila TaxID=211668 RepID=UPI00036CFD02|nr:outer membrane beta-barrel protein [Colwellia piezophila]